MLARRLLANIIHSQKRRILTSPSTTAFVSSSSSGTTTTTKTKDRQLVNKTPRLYLRKLIHQTLSLILFGYRKETNVTLANTSLNRAVKYFDLEMAPNKTTDRRLSEAQESQSQESSPSKRSNNSPVYSQSIEALDEIGTLDELRESYSVARKNSTSCWLDYSNKSCYIYLYRGGGEPSDSMAAFDLDGTIIRPKSNKRIPRSATDWDFFSVWTKVKLQQCLRAGKVRFVIFTNQNGIGLNIVPLEEVQKRIELVTRRLDIPCTVFMAIDKNEFRKPRTGMFQLFTTSFNDSIQLDYGSSFYCGDAIGYPSHSDADIKFAQKLNLPFLTPEKFVRGVKPKLVGQ